MKDKLKEYFKKNKKKCITALLVVVAGIAYACFDYEVDTDKIASVICNFIGGC